MKFHLSLSLSRDGRADSVDRVVQLCLRLVVPVYLLDDRERRHGRLVLFREARSALSGDRLLLRKGCALPVVSVHNGSGVLAGSGSACAEEPCGQENEGDESVHVTACTRRAVCAR